MDLVSLNVSVALGSNGPSDRTCRVVLANSNVRSL